MKTTALYFQCLCSTTYTKCKCEKDAFLGDSIANITVPASVIFVKVPRLEDSYLTDPEKYLRPLADNWELTCFLPCAL